MKPQKKDSTDDSNLEKAKIKLVDKSFFTWKSRRKLEPQKDSAEELRS